MQTVSERATQPDFRRILPAVAVGKMQSSHVTVIGCGGSAHAVKNLFRCGLGSATLVDPDRVERSNLARQDFEIGDLGLAKVAALRLHVHRISPEARVTALQADFCALSDAEIDRHFGGTDLLIVATDHFPAQARGNAVALRLGKPALWVGLYGGAGAGEIVFWHPGLPCYRCLCGKRYEAQSARRLDPASDGADVFSIGLLDSIAGMLAIGLLTAGADNRFGRLIGQLGDRNFIQVKLDPTYRLNGQDLFAEQLGIPLGNDRSFAWNSIVRRDPQRGLPPCPDCRRYGRTT